MYRYAHIPRYRCISRYRYIYIYMYRYAHILRYGCICRHRYGVLDSKDPHGLEPDKDGYRWEVPQGGLIATFTFRKLPATRLHPAMGLHPEEESIIKNHPDD